MKLSFLLIFSLSSAFAFGQKTNLPIDEKTQKVLYTEVVQVSDVKQTELYDRVSGWFKSYFPNPSSVIKEQDAINGTISGQHAIYIYKRLPDGKEHKSGQVRYTIELMVKDGRYKYTISDIFRLQTPKIYIEAWMDEKSGFKEENFAYLNQVDAHMKEMISNLKKAMQQPLGNDTEEDW